MSGLLRYLGEDRRGTARAGALAAGTDLMAWTAERHRAGWRSLVVRAGGEPVAEIGPDLDTGRRRWWAQTGLDGGQQQ